jgi:hypothetical protein
MLGVHKIVFCTHHVALNTVGTVKVPTSSHAFQCQYLCHNQCFCAIAGYFRHGWQSYILLYTVHCGYLLTPLPHCFITSRSLSLHLHCYHYYQHLWIHFILQICLWWFLNVFCFSVLFTLLLALSITLPLLQPHQLTSSLQPVCMLLLLTALPPSLLSVEAAGGSITSNFQHNYLHSSCYRAYCLDLLFMAVIH